MKVTKIYRVTLMVIDHDELGANAIKELLEEQRYPNRAIVPKLVGIEERQVAWIDNHPINITRTWKSAFRKLFGMGDPS